MRLEAQRGTTLVEVMIAGVVLLVALLGFAGMASTSATSTGTAHRRGMAVYAQSGLLERYLVAARTSYTLIPVDTWFVDNCYDINGQVVATNTALPPSAAFTCPTAPTPTYYRTWVFLTGTGPWVLSVYAERMNPIDPGCTNLTRYTSLACVAADVVLTD